MSLAGQTLSVEHEAFADHNGEAVISTWLQKTAGSTSSSLSSMSSGIESALQPDPLPLLIYTNPQISAQALGTISLDFLALAAAGGEALFDCDIQVIAEPQPDIFACIEHYRREKLHRKRRRGHRLPPSYARTSGKHCHSPHSNFLIYLDCADWRNVGPIFVSFGLGKLRRGSDVDTDDLMAQNAINRGRMKLKASRMRCTEEIRDNLLLVFENAGGCDWDMPLLRNEKISLAETAKPEHHLELARPLETVLQTSASQDEVEVRTSFDSRGHPYVTVWSSRHGSEPPEFPFLLYLPGESDEEQEDADLTIRLFQALDLDVLQDVPWRLECYNHLPSLEAAARHYREERNVRSTHGSGDHGLLPPLDYANSPYQRFSSLLLVADNMSELTSHMSLLLFDPAQKPPAEQDQCAEDLVELFKFRMGWVGGPTGQTPRLSRVLYAFWDVCKHQGCSGRPESRSINELLWF